MIEQTTEKQANYVVAFSSGSVIGVYLFGNDNGKTVTNSSKRYGGEVTDFFSQQ